MPRIGIAAYGWPRQNSRTENAANSIYLLKFRGVETRILDGEARRHACMLTLPTWSLGPLSSHRFPNDSQSKIDSASSACHKSLFSNRSNITCDGDLLASGPGFHFGKEPSTPRLRLHRPRPARLDGGRCYHLFLCIHLPQSLNVSHR